jgi:hypothetical protein
MRDAQIALAQIRINQRHHTIGLCEQRLLQ